VKEQAAAIYRKALKIGLVKGRSIRSMVAASLYVALRISSLPRTLNEVSRVSRIKKKELARCYRLIVNELGIAVPRHDAYSFISKIALKIEAPKKVIESAVQILRLGEEKHALLGKDPRGLAAAAIYLGSRMNGCSLTQAELAAAAGVTEVTVRNRYSDLRRTLNIEIPKC